MLFQIGQLSLLWLKVLLTGRPVLSGYAGKLIITVCWKYKNKNRPVMHLKRLLMKKWIVVIKREMRYIIDRLCFCNILER